MDTTVPDNDGEQEQALSQTVGERRRRRSPLQALVGAALVVTGAGAWLAATSYATPARTALVGGNVPVDAGATDPRDISANNSPTLARSPLDEARLAIANRVDSPRFSCALHVSSDGGATWDRLDIPLPDGEEPKCFAPDVAFGKDGTLYVSFVTLKGLGNVPNAVWITTAAAGSEQLTAPTKVGGPLQFQVRLAADPNTPGLLYLSWVQAQATGLLAFAETGNPVLLSRSDDGGRSWGDPVRVSDPARLRVVAPSSAVGSDGQLFLLYLDLGDDRLDYAGAHEGRGGEPYDGPWRLVLARSADKGATWTEAVVAGRLVPTERFVVFLPPSPSLAVDRRGAVYVAFVDGRLGDADVWLWRSRDGRSWAPPVRVNDTRQHDATSQYLPKIALAPDGRLDVVYYDRRRDRSNLNNDVSLQSSFDGGRTFTPSTRLSDRSFSSQVGFGSERGLADLGSRLGLIAVDRRAMAVWTDTRAGTEASRKQDLVRAVVDVRRPRDLPEPFDGAIAAAGAIATGFGMALLAAGVIGRRPRLEPIAPGGGSDDE